jgi:hypothetical protein
MKDAEIYFEDYWIERMNHDESEILNEIFDRLLNFELFRFQ